MCSLIVVMFEHKQVKPSAAHLPATTQYICHSLLAACDVKETTCVCRSQTKHLPPQSQSSGPRPEEPTHRAADRKQLKERAFIPLRPIRDVFLRFSL